MLKRLALAAALLSASIAPAAADGLAEDYAAAFRIFLGRDVGVEPYLYEHRRDVTDGLAGLWTLASLISADLPPPDRLKRACEQNGYTIGDITPFGFAMTLRKGHDRQVVYRYTAISGTTFAEQVDPNELFARLDIPPDGPGMENSVVQVLSRNNLPVTFQRFSPDVLVAVRLLDMPAIYVRCP